MEKKCDKKIEKKNSKNNSKNACGFNKKIIFIVIFVLLLLCLFVFLNFKNNYNEICFEYDNNVTKGVVIYGYKCDFIRNVVIPEEIDNQEVTEIADYAFYNKGLKSVDIKANIRKFGYMSFASNKLSHIDIPVDTEIIDDFAFKENSIKELTLSANLTYLGIGSFSFNDIENLIILENVNEGLTFIGNHAFESNQLRSVKLPYTLEKIGDYAFSDNILLESIIIPSGVTDIGDCALCGNQLFDVINKTDKKFDWSRILTYKDGEEFKTGSVNINPCDDDNEEDCDIFTEIKDK